MRAEYEQMMEIYESLKREVRAKNKHLYERWKAGGFRIDDDIISMYPSLGTVIDQLDDDEEDEECDSATDCGENFIG